MGDSLESLQRRKQSAAELGSVVRTMKAMAASNISQYEMAVQSLQDYYRTASLGLSAYVQSKKLPGMFFKQLEKRKSLSVAVVFGSDQGLVGRFNDVLTDFAGQQLRNLTQAIETWAVGERAFGRLTDAGFSPARLFNLPNSVAAITPLVEDILIKSEEYRERNQVYSLYLFHNSPVGRDGYQQQSQRLFPLDEKWEQEISKLKWPSQNLPQVIGQGEHILHAFVREYLFVSIYKACAESLASENASRLEAMERAAKNIDDILDDLKQGYIRLRQTIIDEELFDVVAGFEALKGNKDFN